MLLRRCYVKQSDQSKSVKTYVLRVHINNQSGAAEAWWAHNPQVPGSKPGSDRVASGGNFFFPHCGHHRHLFLLHSDPSAPQRDRLVLIFRSSQNVDVIGKAGFNYSSGSSTISSVLHVASILLKLSKNWDRFVSLNAADYLLVTQDDLLHKLSYIPKGLNFVNYTSYIG